MFGDETHGPYLEVEACIPSDREGHSLCTTRRGLITFVRASLHAACVPVTCGAYRGRGILVEQSSTQGNHESGTASLRDTKRMETARPHIHSSDPKRGPGQGRRPSKCSLCNVHPWWSGGPKMSTASGQETPCTLLARKEAHP